ncbi:response regulator transcription factor [Streptococcus phocae subsp. salmonis]|uniref:response regulator transcription factor n=1 Tax=Streptococcus phocae TaxID=119224 RepID=UPI000530EF4F|nr:response regulator [Streptococcus phocae]KGR72282.1 AraC family transcriptional regulator [Streptococcus phocae subsp. salmonis]
MYSLLIVEDEYLVRQGICSLVDFERFQITRVSEAENGKIAWELFQETPYDIVLTDINMPKLNGIQLAELIKAQSKQTHVVFLTGYDDFNYALSALKLGADDYLLKPFSKSDIEEMLAKVLSKLDALKKTQAIQNLFVSPETESSSITSFIQQHLADSTLSLKSLSQQLGFSPNYVSVLVKKELGVPFQDYLVKERLKRAKLLLLTTDLKIYEIADQVGFEDMNYFSQRFKQVVGMTPSQYKKGGK